MSDRGSDWDHPLDPVAITTTAIVKGRLPVRRVRHDDGHGGWQFYDNIKPLDKPIVIPKDALLEIDPTLAQITDLPLWWEAERNSLGGPWTRSAAKHQE